MSLDLSTHAFTIGQVALFFDQTTGWLRWRESQDGLKKLQEIGQRRRNNKEGGGDRIYQLADIRSIAEVLHEAGVLDEKNFRVVIKRVNAFSTPVDTGKITSNGTSPKKRTRKKK